MRHTAAGHGESLLVFETGEEVVEALRKFAPSGEVASGHFYGIGGFERATIAYWNWDSKEYEDIAIDQQVEVLSLAGNITRVNHDFKIHAHVVLGRRDGSTIGGHLKSGIVRPTLELVLRAFPGAVVRERDSTTGLDLIRL